MRVNQKVAKILELAGKVSEFEICREDGQDGGDVKALASTVAWLCEELSRKRTIDASDEQNHKMVDVLFATYVAQFVAALLANSSFDGTTGKGLVDEACKLANIAIDRVMADHKKRRDLVARNRKVAEDRRETE